MKPGESPAQDSIGPQQAPEDPGKPRKDPNRLRLAEKGKRLGYPTHDGAVCVGHLARPEPRVVELLHAIRTFLAHPECLALAVESLGAEELPILGRALMRRVEGAA